jgi:hypothetical protein
MTDAPKACPFCGEPPYARAAALTPQNVQVSCLNSGCPLDEMDFPLARWNTRAVPQPQEPTPEAVERAAKAMCASDPSLKQWDDMGDMLPDGTVVVSPEVGRNWWRSMARAALIAARKARA